MTSAPLEAISRVRRLTVLLCLLLFGFATPSYALLTMTLQAQDGDVVLTADGSLNLSAASKAAEPTDCGGAVEPGDGASWAAVVGPPRSASVACDIYTAAISGPAGFGVGAAILASSGDSVYTGIGRFGSMIVLGVPDGYVSGARLGGFSRFRDMTLAALGARPGTYTWRWGSGSHSDAVVLRVLEAPPAAGIPTLSLWAGWLLMASLLGVGALRLRWR
jgi:hypothetical protein